MCVVCVFICVASLFEYYVFLMRVCLLLELSCCYYCCCCVCCIDVCCVSCVCCHCVVVLLFVLLDCLVVDTRCVVNLWFQSNIGVSVLVCLYVWCLCLNIVCW